MKKIILLLVVFLINFSLLLSQNEKNSNQEINDIAALNLEGKVEYVFSSKGRRDPFYDLIAGMKVKSKKVQKGVKPFYINEVKLVGIMGDKKGYWALVETPDGNAYPLRVNDKLIDGVVLEITKDYVKFRQLLQVPIMGRSYKIVKKKLVVYEKTNY